MMMTMMAAIKSRKLLTAFLLSSRLSFNSIRWTWTVVLRQSYDPLVLQSKGRRWQLRRLEAAVKVFSRMSQRTWRWLLNLSFRFRQRIASGSIFWRFPPTNTDSRRQSLMSLRRGRGRIGWLEHLSFQLLLLVVLWPSLANQACTQVLVITGIRKRKDWANAWLVDDSISSQPSHSG